MCMCDCPGSIADPRCIATPHHRAAGIAYDNAARDRALSFKSTSNLNLNFPDVEDEKPSPRGKKRPDKKKASLGTPGRLPDPSKLARKTIPDPPRDRAAAPRPAGS